MSTRTHILFLYICAYMHIFFVYNICAGARPRAADFRASVSPSSVNTKRAVKSPPMRNEVLGGSPRKGLASPRYANSNASLPHESPSEVAMYRKGHFDASTLPRSHDSYEVENLRVKLGDMEAKLLNTQSQLVKERETSRTAKARLAIEMQTRMSSAEQDLLRSKAFLEHKLEGMHSHFKQTRAALEAEKKKRHLGELEIDRLQRSIDSKSLNHTTAQLMSFEENPDSSVLRTKNSGTEVKKIQDLCQANLMLLGQKRSAVKFVVAMNTEVSSISAMLNETIDRMKSAQGMELADEMLATENKALLMAQLQAQSQLQLTESDLQRCHADLQRCQDELAQSNAEFATFKLQVEHNFVIGLEDQTKKLEESTALLKASEVHASLMHKALEQEQERSSAQIADMHEELNSLHQSRMSATAKSKNHDGDLAWQQLSEGISVKLDMKMHDVDNSVEFVQAVKLDLCSALGLSATRIQMHGLRAGSVIVDLAVQEGMNQSDRTSGEIIMELLRQIKDPSSELRCGNTTNKIMSIEIYGGDSLYQQNIQSLSKIDDSSTAINDSTRSTSNWIELVEQQTVQLKRQTADIVELENLNRGLAIELLDKEGDLSSTRLALDMREKEAESLKARDRSSTNKLQQLQQLQDKLQQLQDKLQLAEADASDWKRAFTNLENQLNEHNQLVKQHLDSAEIRADGLQKEKMQLAVELSEAKQQYLRASQESLLSVEALDSPTIIPLDPPSPEGEMLTKVPSKATRAAAPPVPVRAVPPPATRSSPSSTRSLPPSTLPPLPNALPNREDTQDGGRVDMRLNLNTLSFEAVGEKGSAQRVAFDAQLQQDLSRSSGLPMSSFDIQQVAKGGGVVVDLIICAHPAGRGPDPLQVAVDLQKQVKDPNSRLMTGMLTRHMQELSVRPSYSIQHQESIQHKEYKLIRDENQRLREQVQNLRAQVMKSEAEMEEGLVRIYELEQELKEHLRIANTMQAQIDGSIQQHGSCLSMLHDAQQSNEQLAVRLREADHRLLSMQHEKQAILTDAQGGMGELDRVRNARDESAAMVGTLQVRNRELEARLEEAGEQLNRVAGVVAQQQKKVQESNIRAEELWHNHEELKRAFSQELAHKQATERDGKAIMERVYITYIYVYTFLSVSM